jgi:hypothetical protein
LPDCQPSRGVWDVATWHDLAATPTVPDTPPTAFGEDAHPAQGARPGCLESFDSGAFFVQQGKVGYDELFPRLLAFYARNDWANAYVLLDYVPTSRNSPTILYQAVNHGPSRFLKRATLIATFEAESGGGMPRQKTRKGGMPVWAGVKPADCG